MEPQTQPLPPLATPEINPLDGASVYHTISCGPETLRETTVDQTKEKIQPVVEVISQPTEQTVVLPISSNQAQQAPSLILNPLYIESVVPQETSRGKYGIDIGLAIKSLLVSILYFPILLPLIGSFFGKVNIFAYIVTVVVIGLYSFINYGRLLQKAERNTQLSVEEKASSHRDTIIVLSAYVALFGVTLLLIALYGGIEKIFSNTPIILFSTAYIALTCFLLIVAIRNIREKKNYTMLGQFFIFLFSPLMIGFGLCVGAVFFKL